LPKLFSLLLLCCQLLFLIPTLGIYNKFNEIEKDKLPERFVIKCTHDSGGVCICKNKNKFNWEEAEKKINKSLKNEFFWNHREYPYKGIKPRIMIEEYLEDNSPKGLVDYKFFCFHGEPRLVLVASNRQKNVNFDFFDMDFKHCPFKQEYDILSKDLIEKPTLFEEMKKIAKVLSKDILHVRVDFSIRSFDKMSYSCLKGQCLKSISKKSKFTFFCLFEATRTKRGSP
jgi:hypothetical protein